jgi:hypothetical protein
MIKKVQQRTGRAADGKRRTTMTSHNVTNENELTYAGASIT